MALVLAWAMTAGLPVRAAESQPGRDPIAVLERDARTVRRLTLDNGLTVLIKEDRSAPLAAIQVWVGVGSCLEGPYLGSGLSHFLEHMIFKGTPSRKVGDITRAIDDAGGSINAFTSVDRTVFVVDMPASAWRIGLDVLADAVLNASFPEDEWQKERDVIRREIAMNRDNPDRELSRLLFQTAFRAHPLRYPVIGFEDILMQRTRQDLLDFHRAWFMPNNMLVCLVGDVPADEAEAAIRDLFGAAPRRPLPPAVLPAEPAQISPRALRRTGPYKVGRLTWAYHGVSLDSPDAPALDVLAAITGEGDSSRLVRDIKETRRLALSINAWSYTPRDPGLFGITATFEPGLETNLLAALGEQVASWTQTAFTDAELEKARRQVLASCIRDLQTMSGMASSLASGEFYTGDFAYHLAYLSALERLTPESLREAARRYLRPENRTQVILSPLPDPEAAQASDAAPAAPVMRRELVHGLPLLLREDRRLPLVHICAVVGGGLLGERAGAAGSTRLLAELLTRGAAGRSAEDIAAQVESAGGSLVPFSGYNSYGLRADCLSRDAPAFLNLLADCLLQPSFPEDELEKQRALQLAALRRRRESPMAVAEDALRGALFPNHPYRFTPLGDAGDLARLKRQDILDLHARTLVAGNAVIAIFGDLAIDDATALADRAFRRFPAGVKPAPEHEPPKPDLPLRLAAREPKEQAILLVGFPGLDLRDARRDSLDLTLEALNGLSSDLMLSVREARGLAYFTGAYQQTGADPGFVAVYAGTREDALPEVETLVADELARLTARGLRPEEFERGRRQLLSSQQRTLQSNADLAMGCALDELYGLGYGRTFELEKRLAGLTPESVRQAAASLFITNRAAVSIVLPAAPATVETPTAHQEEPK
jgi:zinc protease